MRIKEYNYNVKTRHFHTPRLMRGSGGSWLRGNRWQSKTKEVKLRTTKITHEVTKHRDKAYNMQT